MMTVQGQRPGRRSLIDDEEIQKLVDEGFNDSQIARHFTEGGRRITRQAITLRVNKLREGAEDRSKYALPWRVRQDHAAGWVYRAVLAYGKLRSGRGVPPRELQEMRKLETFLAEYDVVVTYDYDKGFQLRNRRPEDGPSMIAKD